MYNLRCYRAYAIGVQLIYYVNIYSVYLFIRVCMRLYGMYERTHVPASDNLKSLSRISDAIFSIRTIKSALLVNSLFNFLFSLDREFGNMGEMEMRWRDR